MEALSRWIGFNPKMNSWLSASEHLKTPRVCSQQAFLPGFGPEIGRGKPGPFVPNDHSQPMAGIRPVSR
jgi:hypothetical protein